MALTNDEVVHVARLARLRLAPEELEKMRSQLSTILEYVAMLDELDVQDVPITAQVTGLATVMREDGVNSGLPRDVALANAPDQADGMFRVRAVFDDL